MKPAAYRIALGVLVALAIVALMARYIAPFDPVRQLDVVALKNLPPSAQHWFGTDQYSRDVLSRVIYGSQVSLGVAAVAVAVALLIGVAVGAVAGFAGGAVDEWLMRGVDVLLSVPRLLVLIVICAAFGQLSFRPLALVIGLTGWPGMSRLVRARVREIAVLDYVTAARALGVRRSRILLHHVLPGALPQVLVAGTLAVASVIPFEAGLSFIGLGVPAPTASWGNILLDGFDQRQSWWLIVFPALAIVVTVLAVNVVGERLRASLDPHLRPPV